MQNKRIVVKIGTSTLAHPSGLLNIRQVESLCKVLSDLKNAGHELILVSSGAIGMGVGKLSLSRRPEDMPTKQAAAAVGQCELMYTYDKPFFRVWPCGGPGPAVGGRHSRPPALHQRQEHHPAPAGAPRPAHPQRERRRLHRGDRRTHHHRRERHPGRPGGGDHGGRPFW
mgnify:CR=1 FL=1